MMMRKLLCTVALAGGFLLPLAPPAEAAQAIIVRPHNHHRQRYMHPHYYRRGPYYRPYGYRHR
jgi:hypothetical protein